MIVVSLIFVKGGREFISRIEYLQRKVFATPILLKLCPISILLYYICKFEIYFNTYFHNF